MQRLSSSAVTRVTEPGTAWVWLTFVVGLALTIPLMWRAWIIIGPNTYTGGDGKIWQSVIREIREFAPAFHVNILNPLQGAAGFGTPINIWADPVYWPFFSDDRRGHGGHMDISTCLRRKSCKRWESVMFFNLCPKATRHARPMTQFCVSNRDLRQ
jgi:hypothetical protein